MKKKILVLTDHFGNGGAERVASLIINGLSVNKENEVHVCVFQDENNYGVNFEHVHFHLLSPKSGGYLKNVLIRMQNLKRTIQEIRPDVIFSFGPIMASYVVIARWFSGVKDVKIIASERNDPRKEPVSDLKKLVRDFCYNHSDILVCQTPMAVELLKQRKVNTNYVIIPNPITPNLPVWKGENSYNIITAARLTEQKNLPLLIDAFKIVHEKHPNYRLVIYGEGEMRGMLESYVFEKELKDVVTLPGFAKNVHQVMAEAYMYVSSSDYEGISNSMLEALGIGLPCICTDCPVGGASMFIDNGRTGMLTTVGDCNMLVTAMNKLIEDKNLLRNISTASRKVNEELTLERITKMWTNLIR